MRRPPMIPDPSNAAQMIHQAAFVLSGKSLGSLNIAAVSVSFFSMTYRSLSADIMVYDSRLNNFKVHVDSFKNKKKNDTNDSPPSCLGIFPLNSKLKESLCIWEVRLEQ